jgi:hypothetical protein
MLESSMPILLQKHFHFYRNKVSLHVYESVWFQHDGVPNNFARILRIWLYNNFPGR